ncbi:hypothetical protein Q9G87_09300 [Nonomuraea sp. G32]|nr:hypothetical protein [Nonomuraea sp. G32]MDP4502154.1 hypothetical protein [Nonomuraea sp. G32]
MPTRVPDRELELDEVLERGGGPLPPGGQIGRGEVLAVHPDRAGHRLVHAGEELDQGRLARAVHADQGDDAAPAQVEADVTENRVFGAGIGEAHVVEGDAAARGFPVACRAVRGGVVVEPRVVLGDLPGLDDAADLLDRLLDLPAQPGTQDQDQDRVTERGQTAGGEIRGDGQDEEISGAENKPAQGVPAARA